MIPRWVFPVAVAALGSAAGPTRAVRTYQVGNLLYLESTNGQDTVRVGLDTSWGGAIVLVTYNGEEFVNRSDPGREVQIAVWDGEQKYDPCAGCSGSFGWNPVQAGDHYHHGSSLISDSLASDHLYTRTRPIEWFPDNKGGGRERPIPSCDGHPLFNQHIGWDRPLATAALVVREPFDGSRTRV